MKVTLKLFATLAGHLPPEARRLGQTSVEAPPGSTVLELVERFRVPPGQCTLVLVNGTFVRPGEMGARMLADGDVLAIWPPVGGG